MNVKILDSRKKVNLTYLIVYELRKIFLIKRERVYTYINTDNLGLWNIMLESIGITVDSKWIINLIFFVLIIFIVFIILVFTLISLGGDLRDYSILIYDYI